MSGIVERLEQDCYCSDLSDGECVPCQARTEIERLHVAIEDRDAEIDEMRKLATQRGARMQVLHEWLKGVNRANSIIAFDEAASWFDSDGVPR